MRKILHNLTVLSVITSLCSPAYAIDLNTKLKNTDRSLFNTNPGVQVKDGYGQIFGEFNLSSNPMVIRNKTTGDVEPVVSRMMGLDLGANYGLTSWMNVGFLLPVEMPTADKSSTYLNGPYFEAKFKLGDHFAFVPNYQLGMSNKIKADLGTTQDIPMGPPNGAYGAKLVTQWGNVLESWGLAAQVGYVSASGNEFLSIDQTSKFILGASVGMPLSDNINGVVEVTGEKYPGDSFPIEVLGLVNLKQEDYNFQVGAGTGNVQGSGSNTFKAFVGVTMFFGGASKGRNMLPVYRKNNDSRPKSNRFNEPSKPIYEDGIDEQMGPEVMEPEESQAPSIPDVNGRNLDHYPGRNLASESLDPEIMNAIIDSEEANQITVEDPLLDVMEPRVKKPAKKVVEKSVIQQAVDKTKTVLTKKKIEVEPVKTEIKTVEKTVKEEVKKVEVKIVDKTDAAKPVVENKTVEIKKTEIKVSEKSPSSPTVVNKTEKVEVKLVEPTGVKTTIPVVKGKVQEKASDIKPVAPEKVEIKLVEQIEEKPVKKAVVKPAIDKGYFAKLPNGQKVKVFKDKVTQMPSEVGVIYMTEAEYKDSSAKMKQDMAKGKMVAKPTQPKVLNLIKTPKQEVTETPVVIVSDKPAENVKPVVIENKDMVIEIPKATPIVVKEKESDPVMMISEHPDNALEQQGDEIKIVPVDVSQLGKKKDATPVKVVEDKKVETSVDTVNVNAVPEVKVSVEQRQQLKNELAKEFNSVTLEDSRQNLSEKVLAEQAKINEQISAKQKAEAEAKAKLEAEELAIKTAAEEKNLRENAPLVESNQPAPGKAATKEELKAVAIPNKPRNPRPIIIALPQAQLNAFAAGKPIPQLPAPQDAESSAKSLKLLEEADSIEEATGPSYGFGEE